MKDALAGKVAVVTGGTSGIGAGIAALFIKEGAKVVIAGRRRDKGEHVAKSLGDHATFVQTDVTVEADVKAMIEHAVVRFGRLDCLINNAGGGSKRVGIAEADLEQFDATIAVHVRAVLAAMKHAVPAMVEQGGGSIVTVASVNGIRPGLGGQYYSVAKAASIHLTRVAAIELGEKRIRVNTISPGPIVTGIFGKSAGLDPDEADQNLTDAEAALTAVQPRWQSLPNIGRVEDIAQAALYLAGDGSRFVTGHNLVVDGGICAGWPVSVNRDDMAAWSTAFLASRSGRSS
jgi:NAD(P)-dependent dehydrogenase (short-subunit alcohol dehydrogenase family)